MSKELVVMDIGLGEPVGELDWYLNKIIELRKIYWEIQNFKNSGDS